jgi:DNA modification methylase
MWGADYYCQNLPKGGSWLVWDKTGGNESLDKAGFQSRFELCWSKNPHKRKIIRATWIGVVGMSHKDDIERMHPTQKSVKVISLIIESIVGEAIIDPFLGSGTTLIACERLNRKCYGIEIGPKYVAVTLERWHQMTSQTPVLIDV